MSLTLSRRPGEQIKISDDIFVTLVSLKNGQAKIRIEAPESIKILRTELLELVTPMLGREPMRERNASA